MSRRPDGLFCDLITRLVLLVEAIGSGPNSSCIFDGPHVVTSRCLCAISRSCRGLSNNCHQDIRFRKVLILPPTQFVASCYQVPDVLVCLEVKIVFGPTVGFNWSNRPARHHDHVPSKDLQGLVRYQTGNPDPPEAVRSSLPLAQSFELIWDGCLADRLAAAVGRGSDIGHGLAPTAAVTP